ncbi:DrmB family protein [Streptomyces sp. NPDC091271]|uniref:DrmB family protein n=1 Tax=Streptomyces sp. NPDC091271 TaxID=3365980 RepID=UPI0038117D78
MTPPPARRRRTGAPERSYPRRGSVRRAQMITTYGVGSMVAVDNESFIVAGTDSWNISDAPTIHEHRLARALGVKSFRLPPASDDTSKDGVHVRRFPLWHSCPVCHTLQHVRQFNSPPGKNECGDCEEDLVPSRFVMACAKGHIDDFPYWKWAHRKNRQEGETGLCGGEMRLRTNGKTASLRSILVSCTCGVPEVSMEGAFSGTALSDLKVFCSGKRPWLKDAPTDRCSERPRTLQRGSSVAWQPIVRTALSIPPWSDEHFTRLQADIDPLRELYLAGNLDGIEIYLKAITVREKYEFSVEKVLALLEAENQEDAGSDEEVTVDNAFVRLRKQEYERLIAGRPEKGTVRDDQFVCEPPRSSPTVLIPYGVTGPMLVKRLREVRALKAFSRVDTPETRTDVHEAALSLKDLDWLPAMEVQGEGVFLRLDEERLDTWARSVAVAARADRIRANHTRMMRERAQDPGSVPDSPASPRMVLLHTLTHALINEWSLDGGYPAASLRERLYASDTMAGILICTATSDSAGSLGGLVAQGEPERLRMSLDSALDRARWCSADPLCVESEGSGVGGINMAACHACVLLPETSCEHSNGLLDRALLVGTPEDPSIGFFSHVVQH